VIHLAGGAIQRVAAATNLLSRDLPNRVRCAAVQEHTPRGPRSFRGPLARNQLHGPPVAATFLSWPFITKASSDCRGPERAHRGFGPGNRLCLKRVHGAHPDQVSAQGVRAWKASVRPFGEIIGQRMERRPDRWALRTAPYRRRRVPDHRRRPGWRRPPVDAAMSSPGAVAGGGDAPRRGTPTASRLHDPVSSRFSRGSLPAIIRSLEALSYGALQRGGVMAQARIAVWISA